MYPVVPDLVRMLCTNRSAFSRETLSSTRMEAMRALSEQKDNLPVLLNHVVSEEHPAEKEPLMRAGNTALSTRTMLRDAFAGIFGLVEDALTFLVSLESHDGVKTVNNRSQAMLQDLFNTTIDEKLNSIEFEELIFRKVEDVTPSR